MRRFRIVSDGPHRILETASLPGQQVHELELPDEGGPQITLDGGPSAQPTASPAEQVPVEEKHEQAER
jgi:hypothetical protein